MPHIWREITGAGTFAQHRDPLGRSLHVAQVDLSDLESNRLKGTTIPLLDKRKEIYANPVECIKVA